MKLALVQAAGARRGWPTAQRLRRPSERERGGPGGRRSAQGRGGACLMRTRPGVGRSHAATATAARRHGWPTGGRRARAFGSRHRHSTLRRGDALHTGQSLEVTPSPRTQRAAARCAQTQRSGQRRAGRIGRTPRRRSRRQSDCTSENLRLTQHSRQPPGPSAPAASAGTRRSGLHHDLAERRHPVRRHRGAPRPPPRSVGST